MRLAKSILQLWPLLIRNSVLLWPTVGSDACNGYFNPRSLLGRNRTSCVYTEAKREGFGILSCDHPNCLITPHLGRSRYMNKANILSHFLPVRHLKCTQLQFLSVVTHGNNTCRLIYREDSVRIFENRVFKRLFGPKGEEVTARCWKWPKEKIHKVYCSPSIITVIRTRKMRLTF
jgi:hypothetical protein